MQALELKNKPKAIVRKLQRVGRKKIVEKVVRVPFYRHPFLIDLRKVILERVFRFTTFERLEQCKYYETIDAKYNTNQYIMSKLVFFMGAMDRMFPAHRDNCSLGLKLGQNNANLFVNDYLYTVIGKEREAKSQNVLREFLKL